MKVSPSGVGARDAEPHSRLRASGRRPNPTNCKMRLGSKSWGPKESPYIRTKAKAATDLGVEKALLSA